MGIARRTEPTGKPSPSIPIVSSPYIQDAIQWILDRQDDGQWAIHTVHFQKYLGFESTPKDGTPVVGLDRPRLWDIEILPDSEDHDYTRIRYGFIAYLHCDWR
jgi:hypothetical protein